MRIESLVPVQPVERLQATGQVDGDAPWRLQLDAFPGQLNGSPGGQEKDLAEAVRALNRAAEPYDIALQFSSDEETGTIVVKMVKQGTGEIVRQFPDEAMLHLSAVLGKLQGQLFARTV